MQLSMRHQGCIGTRPHDRQPNVCHRRSGYNVHLLAVAAARVMITADTAVVPEQQVTDTATPATPAPVQDVSAAPRRRRRTRTHLGDVKQPARKATAASGQGRNPRIPAYELFQQQSRSGQQGMVVTPASSAAVLPANALSDPQEALSPHTRRGQQGRSSSSSADAEQQQLLAQFEPFSQSFRQVAQQLATRQQLSNSSTSSHTSAAAQAEAAWRSGSSAQRPGKRSKGGKQNTSKLIELFGVNVDKPPATGAELLHAPMSARRVALESPDTLSQQPTRSRLAAQRLASLLMQQQQQRKQQQQQQQGGQQDAQQQEQQQQQGQEGTTAKAAAGASKVRPARVLPTSAPQQGAMRLYVPAPPVTEATSAADRQPLRLLSIRQQQQLRQEARQQAIQKLREKAVTEYQACLERILTWQGSTGQYTYFPEAPRFLPVALQRDWIPSSSSSSSAQGAGDDSTAATVKQLSPSDSAAVKAVSQVVTRQLGPAAELPDRAFKGERGLYLASLSPQAVADRLKRWASCCGEDYVIQLIKREPSLLGLEPQALLKTLEALNRTLQLPTQDCVEFVSKNVVVVGLDAEELKSRLQGLRDAVGLDWDGAVQVAQARPQLLMVHPSHIKGQMEALSKLLPEAAPKLPQAVKRSPFLILKSPRAIARSIQELAEALGLSSWAAARLVAGQPSILSSNFDALQRRLERLQSLTSVSRRWQRALQALSPPLLARCLACSDTTIDRLALLTDVGAAGSSRLPPIHLILTMPENYFQDLLADVAERQLKRQQQSAAASDSGETAQDVGTSAVVPETTGSRGSGSRHKAAKSRSSINSTARSGTAPVAQSAAGSRLLQQLGLNGGQLAARSRSSTRPLDKVSSKQAEVYDDDEVEEEEASDISDRAVREGVLGGDMAWRSTLAGLADALQQSVAGLAGGKSRTATVSKVKGR